MNPFCENHPTPVLMLSKKRSYTIGIAITRGGKKVVVKGYSRFFECPQCKARIRR